MLFRNIFFTVILLLLRKDVNGISKIDPLVDTSVGLIRGIRASDGDYSNFLGIPYAKVDVANPFGPSLPYPPFEDAFEAYYDSVSCPQSYNGKTEGTLDCLQLNIFVPGSASSKNRLPVLVYIHGGGFEGGSAQMFGPKYLVRHDVILVTINYRLGPYGFMCLNNPKISGNQGLKDQLSALRWIKENIGAFGGDVNKVTLFGESAGGISTDLHLFYNQENLFRNVIIQSGPTLGYREILEPDDEVPLKLAAHLGLNTTDGDAALQFLATVDSDLVIAAGKELNFRFRPCVEPEFENVQNFILEHPININIRRKNMPVLIGHNDDEMLMTAEQGVAFYENANFINNFLSTSFNFDSSLLKEMAELIRHFYFGDEAITEDKMRSVVDYNSDYQFIYPTQRIVQKYVREGVKTIYHYVFSYTGQRTTAQAALNITAGAAHGDELAYLFDSSNWPEPSADDQLVIDRMTTLWTNFAKHSNPTPQVEDLIPVSWTPVTDDTLYYLSIDSELGLKTRPFHDRMAFWELFYKLNEKYQVEYKETSS